MALNSIAVKDCGDAAKFVVPDPKNENTMSPDEPLPRVYRGEDK